MRVDRHSIFVKVDVRVRGPETSTVPDHFIKLEEHLKPLDMEFAEPGRSLTGHNTELLLLTIYVRTC